MSTSTTTGVHTDVKPDAQSQTLNNPAYPPGQLMNGMYGYGQASDEIDLVELLGFFWKIRRDILIGLVVGILGGAVVALRVLPVTYKSEIPLSLEKTEPDLSDSKKFLETFNNTLNSATVARSIWRSVFNQSPELGRSVKEAGLSDESLAATQVLGSAPDKAPLRLRESASGRDFVLDVNLPVQGLSPRSSEVFAAAIQHTFSGRTAEDADKITTPGAKPNDGKAPLEVPDEYRDQLLRSKQDYLKIEFLLNKLSRGLPEYASFMNSIDNDIKALNVSITTAETMEQFFVQTQYERIHRMVALLLADGRMKPDEAKDTVQRAQQIRDEIQQLIPLARQEVESLNGATRESQRVSEMIAKRRSVGKDAKDSKDAKFVNPPVSAIPSLVSANISGAAFKLEEPVSKRKIALVLGAFLGAFAGFAVGGLRIFVQKNSRRLREVVAQ